MAIEASPSTPVADGDDCLVIGGRHAGKWGVVQDRKTSKTGHVTITVQQEDGVRLKTLARHVQRRPDRPGHSVS